MALTPDRAHSPTIGVGGGSYGLRGGGEGGRHGSRDEFAIWPQLHRPHGQVSHVHCDDRLWARVLDERGRVKRILNRQNDLANCQFIVKEIDKLKASQRDDD